MNGATPARNQHLRGASSLAGAIGAVLAMTAPAGADPDASWRVDHMVLDAVTVGDQVLVATQSGRVLGLRRGADPRELLALKQAPGQLVPPVVAALAVDPTGRRLAAASTDGRLHMLDLSTDALTRTLERPGLGPVQAAVFLSEHLLLLGDLRGELSLLDLRDDSELFRRQLEYDPVYSLSLDPSGSNAAVSFRSSRIHVVEALTGASLKRLDGHREAVNGVSWLSDDRLVSGSKDKSVLLWDLATGQSSLLYRGDAWISAVAGDPASNLAAFAADDNLILVARPDGTVTASFTGHTAPVQVLLFLDGGRLLSTGYDARVLLWDTDVPEGSEP